MEVLFSPAWLSGMSEKIKEAKSTSFFEHSSRERTDVGRSGFYASQGTEVFLRRNICAGSIDISVLAHDDNTGDPHQAAFHHSHHREAFRLTLVAPCLSVFFRAPNRIKLSSVLRYTSYLRTLYSEHRVSASPAVSQGLCMCLFLCPNAFSPFVHFQSLGSRHLLYEALLAFSSPPTCMYLSFILATREAGTDPMCTDRADQGPVRGVCSRHPRKAMPVACWGQRWD